MLTLKSAHDASEILQRFWGNLWLTNLKPVLLGLDQKRSLSVVIYFVVCLVERKNNGVSTPSRSQGLAALGCGSKTLD
ncbi:hypothetical protein [Richelia intracellularis]|jgi:hypothetical protein|uniref:hypothetical protein n=1 Tax=Richelia intracellularis TaxID=1164990 RepID=UPI0012DC3004|nr:hypothetical protein [Richelia intracellularis]